MPKTLTPEEIAGFKAKLLTLRDRLRGNVTTMADTALNKNRMDADGEPSPMPIHMAEVGTDNFEQEFTLSLVESENKILAQTEDALRRIEDNTYGICEDCEKPIPKARLNAILYAKLCVKCASEAEQYK